MGGIPGLDGIRAQLVVATACQPAASPVGGTRPRPIRVGRRSRSPTRPQRVVIECLGEQLLFFVLMLDAEPIAVQIAVRDKDRLAAFQIAHASEFDKYGPGI